MGKALAMQFRKLFVVGPAVMALGLAPAPAPAPTPAPAPAPAQ